jgi:negative regulator of flagellin synthesis FlgM
MQVYGPAYVHGPQAINAPHAPRPAQSTNSVGFRAGGDVVQISDTARFAELVGQVPDIRQDRVAQIRAQIAEGAYETDEKLNLALDRLLDEIA